MAQKDEKCSNFEDNLKIVRQVPIPKIVDESKLGDVLSEFNHLMTQGTFTKCTLFFKTFVSHLEVIQKSSGSHPKVIRKSSGSHLGLFQLSSRSHPEVIRKSSGSHPEVTQNT